MLLGRDRRLKEDFASPNLSCNSLCTVDTRIVTCCPLVDWAFKRLSLAGCYSAFLTIKSLRKGNSFFTMFLPKDNLILQ